MLALIYTICIQFYCVAWKQSRNVVESSILCRNLLWPKQRRRKTMENMHQNTDRYIFVSDVVINAFLLIICCDRKFVTNFSFFFRSASEIFLLFFSHFNYIISNKVNNFTSNSWVHSTMAYIFWFLNKSNLWLRNERIFLLVFCCCCYLSSSTFCIK